MVQLTLLHLALPPRAEADTDQYFRGYWSEVGEHQLVGRTPAHDGPSRIFKEDRDVGHEEAEDFFNQKIKRMDEARWLARFIDQSPGAAHYGP